MRKRHAERLSKTVLCGAPHLPAIPLNLIFNTMNIQTTAPNSRTNPQSFSRSLWPIILLGLMMPPILGFVPPVQAQTATVSLVQADTTPPANGSSETPGVGLDGSSDTWESNFGRQAARMLREEHSASTRNSMLHNVITVAGQGPNDIDLSATVGALLQICESDPNARRRLMAIQALHAIGTDHARSRLYHHALDRLYRIMQDEPSKYVRQVAASALEAASPINGAN